MRLLIQEVLVNIYHRFYSFLRSFVKKHMGLRKESSNMSVIETLQLFNLINEVQNWGSRDWAYDICLISWRIIRGTPTKLLKSVSLIESKEWRLFIPGDASASIFSVYCKQHMKELVPNDKYSREQTVHQQNYMFGGYNEHCSNSKFYIRNARC